MSPADPSRPRRSRSGSPASEAPSPRRTTAPEASLRRSTSPILFSALPRFYAPGPDGRRLPPSASRLPALVRVRIPGFGGQTMSRISRLGRSQVTGAARDSFERKIAERGSIPNMYRIFAHRPWLLTTMDAHFSAVMGSGTVPLRLKEMLALQTSLVNACGYGMHSHTLAAERTGATKDQI